MRASVNILPLRYLHFVDASDGKDMMLALADRGGLLAPKRYCFSIYAIAVQVYTKLRSADDIRHKFLCSKKPRAALALMLKELVEIIKTTHFCSSKLAKTDITTLFPFCNLSSTVSQKMN